MLLTLTSAFNKGIAWLEFQANKEFISNNLCINKSRPLLHCNGKCQLLNKMEGEQQNNSQIPAGKLKTGIDATVLPINTDLSLVGWEPVTNHIGFQKPSSYKSPVFAVFHPPA